MKVDVIKKYFQSWLDNDVEIVKQTFSENALYSECYGPEYHGLPQIVTWFENWNNKGQVLEWTIKRIFEQNQTLIVEWYFRCNYDGKIDGFDGVTIADFDKDMKILKLCEFQSKAEHYYHLAVTYSGDVVLLFMVGSEYNDDVKSSDITAAFEALA